MGLNTGVLFSSLPSVVVWVSIVLKGIGFGGSDDYVSTTWAEAIFRVKVILYCQ